MNVARLYLRVSTDEQDLARQASVEANARQAGYYIAGIYREKASGARVDRPELLRMIADLQSGEVVTPPLSKWIACAFAQPHAARYAQRGAPPVLELGLINSTFCLSFFKFLCARV